MTKTIEEAAKSIAKDFIMEHKSRINNDAPLTHECVQYAVERIFAMPLSERLTAEEKERVIRTLNMYYGKWREHPNEATEAVHCAIKETLESIFGKELFEEE